MEKNTARLEAFSDGIFGVAITLLAIEIGIKEYEGANNLNLWDKIIEKWPEYFTYFNSFATVLLMWMGHNKIFEQLKKSNHWVVLLNGLMLLLVVLFPFPTKLVGSFIGTNAQETAVSFYAGFTGCITLSMLLLNIVIINNESLLISPETSVPWLKNMIKGQILGFIVYEASAILALQYSVIALMITFLMWIFWAIVSMDRERSVEK
ncbi:TMEM175 family protein [Chryseobacterium ginsenosidimutans]|uniref:TMEM175 family protein n=1 Tax=Chryseobacterium ginsenosidimutans TaxID=687846 RepID=UPI0031CEBBCE